MSQLMQTVAQPVDDTQLLRLASDPRTRLFAPLRGATVFGPLVILAGLIPCLAVVKGPELTDFQAGWCLRTMDVTAAGEIQDWLEPGLTGLGKGYVYQPPLSSWLLALLAPRLSPDHIIGWRSVSVVASCCTIWAMYLLGRRIGGASFGLLAVMALSCHPVALKLATDTSPAALGAAFLVITIWGFFGHLEGPSQLVSMRMLAGSLAWGLALLAVGPVAIVLFVPMLIHVWSLHEGRTSASTGSSGAGRLWQLWLGVRTLVVFILTALSFSGWWQLMMLTNHGSDFWFSWWSGQVALNIPPETPHSCWRIWLEQSVFLCGWIVVGLISLISELRNPTSELARRRCQFILYWWLTVLAVRILFDIPVLRQSALIGAYDAMLLLPTTLIVAYGVRAIVLRQAGTVLEAGWIASTFGLFTWRMTSSIWAGLSAFTACIVIVVLLPTVTPRLRRGARNWTERDWNWLLRGLTVTAFAGHVAIGLATIPRHTQDSDSLSELRRRIAPIAEVPRVTLMTQNGIVPEALLFVLRSRWPGSQFVVSGANEGKLLRPTEAAPAQELVVEWTRHELRIANELPADRQAAAVGDPLRFRGRRIMIYRVGARQK